MSTVYVYFAISSLFLAVVFAAVGLIFVRRRNSYKKLIEKELGDPKSPPSTLLPIMRIEKVSTSSACTIPSGDEDVGLQDSYSSAWNLFEQYSQVTSTLKVHLLEAVDLPFKDLATKSCDPYVSAMLLPNNTEVVRSKYRNNTLNPTFNETLRFHNIDPTKLNFMTLCIHVNDHDFFRHDETIGEILLPLRNVNLDRKPVYWKDLKPATIFEQIARGSVRVSLRYRPQYETLSLIIVRVLDLPVKNIGGSTDPYIKLWLLADSEHCQKSKNDAKMHCLTPAFDEPMDFNIPVDKLEETLILASIFDHEFSSAAEEIGHVLIGASGCETGKKHWSMVTEYPNQTLTMWHPLYKKIC